MTNSIRLADPVWEDHGDLASAAFEPYTPPPKPCNLCGDTGKVEVREALPDDHAMVVDFLRYGCEEGITKRPQKIVMYECWRCNPAGLPTVLDVRVQRWWEAASD